MSTHENELNNLTHNFNQIIFNKNSSDFNVLNGYDLINTEDILKFILKHDGLIELLNKVNPLIKKYFSNYNHSMEFIQDPEFESLNQLLIYVSNDDSNFDNDWKLLGQLKTEIRSLNLSNNEIKRFLEVDLG